MTCDKITLAATTQFRAPKSVLVIVGYDGSIKNAVEDDGHPFDYDLDENECFVRYVLDPEAAPVTRPLKETP